MRTRPLFRTAWAAVVCAAGVVGGNASAQSPTPPAPRYYPGTISPQTPQKPPVAPAPTATPPKPKLFSASGEGVRPAGATDPIPLPPPDVPRPFPEPPSKPPVPLTPPDLLPTPVSPGPTVTTERGPSPAVTPPSMPVERPSVTPAPVPAGVPTVANLSAKQTPSVTVEYEMPESVGVGQPLAYTLVVRNTGTDAVSNVRVDQELPTGVAFQGSEPAADTSTAGRLGWAVGTLDAGGEKRIQVTVKPAEEGEVAGRATVSVSTSVEARVKVTRPRIGVALTAPETVRVGEKVLISIKLTNTGSGAAAAMTLHARLTDGLSHPAGNVIEAPLANLPAGESKTLTLECTAAKAGPQQCTLTVFADTNPGETAKATVNLVEPQLVAKQTGPAKCLVKGEPVYQIDLANPGTAATDPVSVWTVIPEGFEVVQASDDGAFTATNRTVGWRLDGLPAGGTKSLTLKLRSVGPTEATVRTIIQAAADGGKGLEAKCETAVTAEGVPALRIVLVDVEDPVEVGSEAVYEVKVTNQGTGPCTNVTVTAELADGTVLGTTAGPTTGKPTASGVAFDPLAVLPVKGEAVFKVKVKGTASGDTRFRVRVGCDQIKLPVLNEENTRFYKQ